MNKQNKEYVASRIRNEIAGKLIKCSCKPPNLMAHLRKAAVEGTLELRPSKQIKDRTKVEILAATDSYERGAKALGFELLFKEPKDYVAQMTAHLLEEEQVKEANAQRQAFAQNLIDQVFLDKFDDPEEPISLIVAYKP